jgi:hypothetical protein
MFFLHIPAQAFVELLELSYRGFCLEKDRVVNLFLGVPAGFAHDDGIAFLVPFQDRARADAEFSSHFRRNRNLPLSGDF